MTEVIKHMKGIANDIYQKIIKKKVPSLDMPIRSLQNVNYDSKIGYFELKGKILSRTLGAATIKTFAQTLLMMNESKKIVETNDIATKREIYYVSKNWGEAMFREQPESDTVMDDIEAMLVSIGSSLDLFQKKKEGMLLEGLL